jgi:hypothetical protein
MLDSRGEVVGGGRGSGGRRTLTTTDNNVGEFRVVCTASRVLGSAEEGRVLYYGDKRMSAEVEMRG